jgi:hypothetical protein
MNGVMRAFGPSDGHGDLMLRSSTRWRSPRRSVLCRASAGAEHERLLATLLEDPRACADLVAEHLQRDPLGDDASTAPTHIRHLALVVDQLEEIYSDERIDQGRRERFAEALNALARTGCVWIVATLRSDLYPKLTELPVLLSLKEGDGQFDLLPPSMREIGQIIRLPAAAAGLRFESRAHTAERLDETIRDAAAGNAAALPLLEFLLEELYKRRSQDNVLTFAPMRNSAVSRARWRACRGGARGLSARTRAARCRLCCASS